MRGIPLAGIVAIALAAISSLSQDPKPVAPDGWSMQIADDGWVLKPDGLKTGQSFIVVLSKGQKATGSLKAYFDALWATAGVDGTLQRAPQTLEQKAGDWDFIRGIGVLTKGIQSLQLQVTALQKDQNQVSMVVFTDSPDTFQVFGSVADRVLMTMLGVTNTAVVSDGFQFDTTFPTGWKVMNGTGARSAHRDANTGIEDRILSVYQDEPIQETLEKTFASAWDREIARASVHVMNPGLLAPERPQPLRRRLKNGLAVWYEGGECKFGIGRYCYLQLMMLPGSDRVTIVAALYFMSEQGLNEQDRAPIWEFLEGFKSASPVSKTALFTSADCVGHWKMNLTVALAGFYSSSGAYMGDASSGGLEDLTLNADGTYSRIFAAKTPTMAMTSSDKGTWKVEDTILTLTPNESSRNKGAKTMQHRIYGKALLNGSVNLLVGAADGSRVPTNALESGATLEIAIRGGSLLRYVQQ